MLMETKKRAMRIFPRLDPGVRWIERDNLWLFTSGYRFQFGHCHNRDDWGNYMGNEYTHLAFDELIQFEEEQFDQIETRVRATDPVLGKMLKVRMCSNPMMMRQGETFSVSDPTWVRRRFVDPEPDGNVIFKRDIELEDGTTETVSWMFMPARLKDNPDPAFRRRYEAKLRNKPAHIRMALLDGDWYITIGSFYADAWRKNLHVSRQFRIPLDWPVFRSMDWGYKTHGCVHWYAMDPDGNLFVFYEYTFRGKSDVEVALAIQRIENEILLYRWRDGRSQLTGPADTQLWEKRGEIVKSKAETMFALGVSWTKADKRSRTRNAQEIHRRLRDHQGGTTTPGLVIFNNCRHLIRTLPAIQADDKDSETPAESREDHWHDSLGYGCAFASWGKEGIPKRMTDYEWSMRQRELATPDYYRPRGMYGAQL